MRRFLFLILLALGMCVPLAAAGQPDEPDEEVPAEETVDEQPADDATATDDGATEADTEEPVVDVPMLDPVTDVKAIDRGFDHGDAVIVSWTASADTRVTQYIVRRAVEEKGLYQVAAVVKADMTGHCPGRPVTPAPCAVIDKLERDQPAFFTVAAADADGASSFVVAAGPATPTRQLLDALRFWVMIITIILCGAVIFWIRRARAGKPINVRKIAGLEAVDEAVGRATEMGRSILFIPGIQDMNDIQTIAGINVMARVAKTSAEYDAKIEVPTSRSLVMTTARETVQAAFLAAGRPDAYNEDLIYYVTDEQFGYVAYLQGMMVREKPAACFYMGSFFAESLILAETGNSVGAIQVAGTAQPAQLPFFVAACDYTLIGEEFFAASAYLSGSPEELGSLKGQDVGKVVVAVGLLFGVLTMTLYNLTGAEFFGKLTSFIKTILS